MYVKYNGNNILTADNTEFTILRDVIVGDGSTVRNVIMKKGSLTLNSGDLKLTSGKAEISSTLKTGGNIFNGGGLYFGDSTSANYKITSEGNATLASLKIGAPSTVAQINSSGSIYGSHLYLHSGSSYSYSTRYASIGDSDLSINITKNSKGWTNLSSALGKLAFADEVKKKFDVKLSGTFSTVSYGSSSNKYLYVKNRTTTYYETDGTQDIISYNSSYNYYRTSTSYAGGVYGLSSHGSASVSGTYYYSSGSVSS